MKQSFVARHAPRAFACAAAAANATCATSSETMKRKSGSTPAHYRPW
jgi:hypothetical protein